MTNTREHMASGTRITRVSRPLCNVIRLWSDHRQALDNVHPSKMAKPVPDSGETDSDLEGDQRVNRIDFLKKLLPGSTSKLPIWLFENEEEVTATITEEVVSDS